MRTRVEPDSMYIIHFSSGTTPKTVIVLHGYHSTHPAMISPRIRKASSKSGSSSVNLRDFG